MITGSYDLDIIEKTFNVALRIDLTFKMLVNVKAQCSKYEDYEHYDYQCISKSQHVRIVLSDDIDNLKIVEDIYVPSKNASIIEDISISSDTLIIDKVHMSFDSINNDVDEIIELNTSAVPSKSLKLSSTEYTIMVLSISESPEFFIMI